MSQSAAIKFGRDTFHVRAIAFDKDGTLIESQPFWHELWSIRKRLIEELAGKETAAMWEREVGTEGGVFDRRGPFCMAPFSEGRIILAALLYRTQHWSWDECRDKASALIDTSNRLLEVARVTHARPGTMELVHSLKEAQIPIGIVTSDSRPRALRSLEVLGFPEEFWDFFLTASDGFASKPAPDMVLAIANQLGCSPREIAVVGDSVVDARMAKAAGALAVSVPEIAEDARFLEPETDIVLLNLTDIALV